jgi:hypothetical protein
MTKNKPRQQSGFLLGDFGEIRIISFAVLGESHQVHFILDHYFSPAEIVLIFQLPDCQALFEITPGLFCFRSKREIVMEDVVFPHGDSFSAAKILFAAVAVNAAAFVNILNDRQESSVASY